MSRPGGVPIPERLADKALSVATTQLRMSRRRTGRDETKFGLRSGLSLELIRPSPPRGHDARGYPHTIYAQRRSENPTTVGNPHPTRQSFDTTRRVRYPGSHLGSTLKPGGAVLTRGVFRRSGSVACIRVDASPNEVLTRSIMHDEPDGVKPPCRVWWIFTLLWGAHTGLNQLYVIDLGVWLRCGQHRPFILCLPNIPLVYPPPRGRNPLKTSATTKSAT